MKKPDPYTWPERSPAQRKQDFCIAVIIGGTLVAASVAVLSALIFIAFGGQQ